jgi:hypothetical protein
VVDGSVVAKAGPAKAMEQETTRIARTRSERQDALCTRRD